MRIQTILFIALLSICSASFALVGRGYDNNQNQTDTNPADNNNPNSNNYDSRLPNGRLGPDVEKEGARQERQEWNAWY